MLNCALRRIPRSAALRPANSRPLSFVARRHHSSLIAHPRPAQAHANSNSNTGRTRVPSSRVVYVLGPQYASFHSTPPTQGLPLIPLLATVFKASTGFEIARTASRIVLTFFPLIWLSNMKAKKMIKYAAIHGHPASEEKKARLLKKINWGKNVLRALMFIPAVLFWATIVASLERTPLTGRWRMILLSPEEEDEIAARLAGPGWYRAINGILEEEGSPRIIPASDWRYKWVNDTLRTLESSIPVLAREPELCPNWTEVGPDCAPMPPPAEFPLRPRPRASEYIHWMCNRIVNQNEPNANMGANANMIPGGASRAPTTGAPYSLLLVDKPDASNAFSYGFGPNGGSGIVVYSGFLDDILAKTAACSPQQQQQQSTSLWSKLFGGLLFSSSSSSSSSSPFSSSFSSSSSSLKGAAPTPEQTTELAILLAHEMAHLILAHHLESLSSVNVIVPGTLSIASDVIRVLIFPVTMLFGPFVNDAVAQLGKVGSGELLKISEACSSIQQEIEADVVSARLLAHAGFDARATVRFWEERAGTGIDCSAHGSGSPSSSSSSGEAEPEVVSKTIAVARQYMGTKDHPAGEERIRRLKDELERWERERQKAVAISARASASVSANGAEGNASQRR